MSDPAAALARAADAGIHRIPVPTPFTVGDINCYLIEDDPLTLVDTGPNWGSSLDVLVNGLDALGHKLADIGLLLLSHQHSDHMGLAGIIARRSGCDVVTYEHCVPWMTDYEDEAKAENEFAISVMKAHGVSETVWTVLPQIVGVYRMLGASTPVSSTVVDGDEIRLRDRVLKVGHRPGHSPGDLIFHDPASGIVLSADHLIGHISSNPLLMRPLEPEARTATDGALNRPHQLAKYIASMEATRDMPDADLFLPGHGDPVTDHVKLITDRLRMHDRRKEKIGGMIEQGPNTAHGLARDMWGDVATTQTFLTLCEVLGHADLLVNDGRIEESEADGVVTFTTR